VHEIDVMCIYRYEVQLATCRFSKFQQLQSNQDLFFKSIYPARIYEANDVTTCSSVDVVISHRYILVDGDKNDDSSNNNSSINIKKSNAII
jgi:hypothetical protein